MNKKYRIAGLCASFVLIAFGTITQPHVANAQFIPGCGGTAVTGIKNLTCGPKIQICTSAERAVGNFSFITCPVDTDPYWNDYGSCVVDPTCANPPTTATFTGNPTTVVVGNATSLSWSSTNATSCTSATIATGGATSGSVIVTPPAIGTYYYDVSCTGLGSPSGIKSVTITVIAPPFDASCSVSPTTAIVGQNVTWSALAWNGVAPYTYQWIGQLIDGLLGQNTSIAYTSTGTKTASVKVTDSTINGGGASVTDYDDQICNGTLLASNVTGTVSEDGGTDASARREMYSLAEGVYYGGLGPAYNPAYASTYAAVKANPFGYCVSGKLMQACQPIGGWGGCNYTFKTDIYSGQTSRAIAAGDFGDTIPNTNLGFGLWDRTRFYGAVKGAAYVGNGQIITRACSNSVAVSPSPNATAALSVNPISVVQGNTSTLTWSSTNATSCVGTNFNTSGAVSGSLVVTPGVSTTYSVTCSGSGAPAISFVTVTVTLPNCKYNYVDGTDITDLSGRVYSSCRLPSIQYLPQCAVGLSAASSGTDAPPGPPTACKLGSCEKLVKVGPDCAVPLAANLSAGPIAPTTAVAGTPVTLTALATNDGTAVSGSFPVLFQVQTPADLRESSYVGPIVANASTIASVSYTFPSAATYQVRACANTNISGVNIVAESNYADNCGPWTAVVVAAAAQPDLTAVLNTPPSATAGTPVTLSGVVSNSISAATGAGFTDLFQRASDSSGTGATDIGTYANAALAGGANNPATLSYTFPSAGTFYIRICADKSSSASTGVITESNEGNNCAGAGGANWTAITVNPSVAPAPTCTFSANPTGTVPSTLTWSSTNATSCTGGGFSTGNATAGSASVSIAGTYTLSCTGAGGSCSNAVTVGGACSGTPTGTLTATPNRIRASTPTSVTFSLPSVQNVQTSCTLSGQGIATQTYSPTACTVSGSFTTTISIATQTVYTLTCDGVKTSTAIVNVLPNFREF